MIHEFFVIDYEEIPKDKGCYRELKDGKKIIEVHDDVIRRNKLFFQDFRSFRVSFKNPGEGLDYLGITIIPSTSINDFMLNVTKAKEKIKTLVLQQQVDELILLCEQALKENKYIIHWGL